MGKRLKSIFFILKNGRLAYERAIRLSRYWEQRLREKEDYQLLRLKGLDSRLTQQIQREAYRLEEIKKSRAIPDYLNAPPVPVLGLSTEEAAKSIDLLGEATRMEFGQNIREEIELGCVVGYIKPPFEIDFSQISKIGSGGIYFTSNPNLSSIVLPTNLEDE